MDSKNAKIPKKSQFVGQNRQKSEQKWSKMTVYNGKINFLLNPFLTKKKLILTKVKKFSKNFKIFLLFVHNSQVLNGNFEILYDFSKKNSLKDLIAKKPRLKRYIFLLSKE